MLSKERYAEMIDHYNAFISYKHAPEDNKVAETIQRELERFHIPYRIRKQTGIKRINRIFRDKNELPITSDLSETIANALEHSDYLIVICSTNTKESMWVPREIEYFLRNHSIHQVLTVLVNGEPDEVIPEVLTQNVEPLSCDYRMPIRKANKVELPRLASALIGCSYDELMNRRRQYIMRRVILGFSAAFFLLLAFSAYMLYSRNKINENYIAALRNQSKYLSNESKNMLENEQRITAVQLALAALPKDENDERPVTPEAINALSKATLAYESEQPLNIHDQWTYKMHNDIKDFRIAPNGSSIAALDSENQLQVWDTKNHKSLMSINKKQYDIKDFSYVTYDTIAVYNLSDISLYDTNTGELKWSVSAGDKSFLATGCVIADEYIYIATYEHTYIKIDISSGEIIDEIEIKLPSEKNDILFYETIISPDFTKIAVRGSNGYDNTNTIAVTDLKTRESTFVDLEGGYITNLIWTDNNNLVYSTTENTYQNSFRYKEVSVVSNDTSTIHSLDTSNMTEKWTADFNTTNVSVRSKFCLLPKSSSVCYFSGNNTAIYDINTGKAKYTYNLNSPIVFAEDINNNGFPAYISSDGSLGTPLPKSGTDSIALKDYFTDDLDSAEIKNGYYVHKNGSSEIIYYQDNVYDTNWKSISSKYEITGLSSSFLDDDLLSVVSGTENETVLTLFLLGDELKSKQISMKDSSSLDFSVVGSRNKTVYAVSNEDLVFSLLKIDIDSGKIESKKLCDAYVSMDDVREMEKGKLVFFYNETGKNYVNIYDSSTDEVISKEIEGDELVRAISRYYPESSSIYIAGEDDYIMDEKTGKYNSVELPDSWSMTHKMAADKSGQNFAITDDTMIRVVNRSGKKVYDITSNGVTVTGLAFYENDKSKDDDYLLVILDNGTVQRYNKETGAYIGTTEIAYKNPLKSECTVNFDYDASTVYIQSNTQLVMLDSDSWSEITSINCCLGFHDSTNRFFTYSTKDDEHFQIGYFDRYSTLDLIKKARDIVGDSELSEEQKIKYGIED